MKEHNKPVVVVRVRRSAPGPAYASKAGDQRRQGRASGADANGSPVAIIFVESSAMIEAKLGKVLVGVIVHDVASGKYLWSMRLAEMPTKPKVARNADTAKDALSFKIREWCEAAGLISARRRHG